MPDSPEQDSEYTKRRVGSNAENSQLAVAA